MTSLISRIASQIPDSVDLGDERAVFGAVVRIDALIMHAPDDLLQMITEEARRLRAAKAESLLSRAFDVAAWLIFCAGMISLLFVGNAFAAEHAAPVASRKGEAALIVLFITGFSAFVWCVFSVFKAEVDGEKR